MSLILPSSTAPSQPANPAPNATTRGDEPGPGNAGSFDEVLARSLAPAGERAGKDGAKEATATPERRRPDARKADPAELLGAIALPVVASAQKKDVKAAAAGGTADARDNPLAAPTTAALTGLPAKKGDNDAGAPALPGPPMPVTLQKDAGEATPPLRLSPVSEQTAPESDFAGVAARSSAPDAGSSRLPIRGTADTCDNPLAAPVNGSAAVKRGGADAGASALPGPAMPVTLQKDAGEATLPGRLSPVSEQPAPGFDSASFAARSSAPDAGSAHSQRKRDDHSATRADERITASVEPAPDVGHSWAKGLVSATTPCTESAATNAPDTTSATSPAPGVDTLNASATLPVMVANAPALAPEGAPAPSAPTPLPTPSLHPEVGSSEWGKALGQQVIQLGKAGHEVAELQLNPAGLGPLKVKLSMNDHQMQAMFVSEHSSVRAAVEAALPQLRLSLADSGISLGNTSVGTGSQQQTAFAHRPNTQPGHRNYRSDKLLDTTARASTAQRQSNGISVDTYA